MDGLTKLKPHGDHRASWITISTDEYESLLATLEILSSPKAMEKIRKGEKELYSGKGKRLEDVKKELDF